MVLVYYLQLVLLVYFLYFLNALCLNIVGFIYTR